MTNQKSYQELTEGQIKALISQGCTAEDFKGVKVADGFDVSCIVNTRFSGEVKIGNLAGEIESAGGIKKPCGIYNATIINCTVGDNSRIANVAGHIANYDIADNVCVENTGIMQTNPGAAFGNGVEVEVLNEAGGREVMLFDELSSQFAYLMCLHRYRPKLIEKLKAIANNYIQSVQADRGTIGSGASIFGCTEIVNVRVGAWATVKGAWRLVNGTILSSKDASAVIGSGVDASDFIIAESSSVKGGAILSKVYVGQGCKIDKQFSAENCLFFANSEGFHGEACSVFAGPYTVTHHKSTLLIAGLFSFFNAGSGTNQSNHMYKLGPVHEGKLLRGTKTGSFAYMMWPCVTGPFSVVLGKHMSTFDVSDFPFSHLEARSDGKCNMVPGLHLTTVGTVRDGAKWPARDRRKGRVRRDIISFDVFSPYTVGKMIKANAALKSFHESADKTTEDVFVNGAIVKRPILRSCQKYYRNGINMYLLKNVITRAEKLFDSCNGKLVEIFADEVDSVYSFDWVDIGGQLMGKKRLTDFEGKIENGTISTVSSFIENLQEINQAYRKDEWIWVRCMYKETFGVDLENPTAEDILKAAKALLKVESKFLSLVVADAGKEFSELSHCGFGQDGSEEDVNADFDQVRGFYEENKFVKEMQDSIEELKERISKLEQKLSGI